MIFVVVQGTWGAGHDSLFLIIDWHRDFTEIEGVLWTIFVDGSSGNTHAVAKIAAAFFFDKAHEGVVASVKHIFKIFFMLCALLLNAFSALCHVGAVLF